MPLIIDSYPDIPRNLYDTYNKNIRLGLYADIFVISKIKISDSHSDISVN